MKYLAALAALLYSSIVTPAQTISEWWQAGALGAPCTTKTDRIEGTCKLEVKRRPTWQKDTTTNR